MTKALVDEFCVEYAAHDHGDFLHEAVWALMVCLILLDKLKVDIVNIVIDNFID